MCMTMCPPSFFFLGHSMFSVPFQSTGFAMHQKFNGHALHQTLLSSPAVAATLSLSWPLPCRPSASSCLEMQLRLHRVHIFLITILMRRVLCYTKRKNRIARSPAHTHLLTHTHSLHTLATRNTPLCQLADIDVARRRGTSSLDTQKTAAPSPLPSTTKN